MYPHRFLHQHVNIQVHVCVCVCAHICGIPSFARWFTFKAMTFRTARTYACVSTYVRMCMHVHVCLCAQLSLSIVLLPLLLFLLFIGWHMWHSNGWTGEIAFAAGGKRLDANCDESIVSVPHEHTQPLTHTYTGKCKGATCIVVLDRSIARS